MTYLSLKTHTAAREGGAVIDEDLTDDLANLDVSHGQARPARFVTASKVWTIIEDEDAIAEALIHDIQDTIMTLVHENDVDHASDDDKQLLELEGSQYKESLGSPHAQACGVDGVAKVLRRTRNAFFRAHAEHSHSRQTFGWF